jgi:hypothetical protein
MAPHKRYHPHLSTHQQHLVLAVDAFTTPRAGSAAAAAVPFLDPSAGFMMTSMFKRDMCDMCACACMQASLVLWGLQDPQGGKVGTKLLTVAAAAAAAAGGGSSSGRAAATAAAAGQLQQ